MSADPELSDEARQLLLAVAEQDVKIFRIRYDNMTSVNAGKAVMCRTRSQREVARWSAAIQELCDHGLIASVEFEGIIFELTHLGYELADRLKRDTGPWGPDEMEEEGPD